MEIRKLNKGKMKKAILYVTMLEWEYLLDNRLSLLGVASYTLFILTVSLSKELQESYFTVTGSLPVTLIDFIFPVFFMLLVCFRFVPAFAGDEEKSVNQIPAVCYLGRKRRNVARLIASVLYVLFMGSILITVTFGICFMAGCFSKGTETVICDIGDMELDFQWNIWQHFGYGAVCLLIGGVVLDLLVLFFSSHGKSMITVIGAVTMVILLEYLCHRFAKLLLLREYNIWVFFRPYYLYVPNILVFSPCVNLMLFTLSFLPLCGLGVWRTVEHGALPD